MAKTKENPEADLTFLKIHCQLANSARMPSEYSQGRTLENKHAHFYIQHLGGRTEFKASFNYTAGLRTALRH